MNLRQRAEKMVLRFAGCAFLACGNRDYCYNGTEMPPMMNAATEMKRRKFSLRLFCLF